MKICITSQGVDLDAKVDPRFGRCTYFVITDTGSDEFEVFENQNVKLSGGAGIQSGQLMASKEVKAVLTGNVGPNAFNTLNAAGIVVYTNVSGTIREAIELYKENKLHAAGGSSVQSKFGWSGR